jgi:hypothetical protein
VYRLLFMFYIEARPELGYVPINKSEIYLKGYSLRACATWNAALSTPHAREGTYFDPPCAACSSWWPKAAAWAASKPACATPTSGPARCRDTFALAPLDSRLFDEPPCCWARCVPQPHLAAVIKHVAQQGPGQGAAGPGQLPAAVHQPAGRGVRGLLSYRGFFAAEDLYEVKPAPKKGRAAARRRRR